MHYRIFLFLALLGILHPIKTERNIVDGRQYRCELFHRSSYSEDRPYIYKDYRSLSPELVNRNQRSQLSSRFRDHPDLRFLQQNLHSRTYNDRLMFPRNIDQNEAERIRKDRQTPASETRHVAKLLEQSNLRNVMERIANQRNDDRRRDHIRSKSLHTLRTNERRISRLRTLGRSISSERDESNIIMNLNEENRLTLKMNNVRRQMAERKTVSQSYRRETSRIPSTNPHGEDLHRYRQADQRRNVIENRRVASKREGSVRLLDDLERVTRDREERLVERNVLRENRNRDRQADQRRNYIENRRVSSKRENISVRQIDELERVTRYREERLVLRNVLRENRNREDRPLRDTQNLRRQTTERRSVSQVSRRDLSRNALSHQYGDDLIRERQLEQRRNDIHRRNVLSEGENRLRQREYLETAIPELRQSQRNELRRERSLTMQQREIVKMEQRVHDNPIESKRTERLDMRSADRRNNIARNLNDERSSILRRERTLLRNLDNSHDLREQRRETKSYSVQVRHMERDVISRRVRDYNAQTYRKDERHTERGNSISSERLSRERNEYGIDRERNSRPELARISQVLRDASRVAVPRERISREYSEHILRNDLSKNIVNSIKNNDISHPTQWQILIYTIQGIYLTTILFKIFIKREPLVQKHRSFGWFTVDHPMKLD